MKRALIRSPPQSFQSKDLELSPLCFMNLQQCSCLLDVAFYLIGKVLYAVEAQPGHFYLPRPVLIDVSHILEAHPSHLAALCLNSEVQWMTVADEAQRI